MMPRASAPAPRQRPPDLASAARADDYPPRFGVRHQHGLERAVLFIREQDGHAAGESGGLDDLHGSSVRAGERVDHSI
jgi:hypothetical protein